MTAARAQSVHFLGSGPRPQTPAAQRAERRGQMKNRSAVLVGPTSLEVVDRPVPIPDRYQLLVRVEAVGICGSDVHYYEHGRIGPYVVEQPMIVGHEAAGVVVAVGESV